MFYNWCKGTTIILKIARNPTFFMYFCKEKVVFRAHSRCKNWLKVENPLEISTCPLGFAACIKQELTFSHIS